MLLDAQFPETLSLPVEEQPEMFVDALRQAMDGIIETRKFPEIHAALEQSSLRVLLA